MFSRLSCHAEIGIFLAGHVLSITGNIFDLSSQFLTQAIMTLGISQTILVYASVLAGPLSLTAQFLLR